MPGIRGFRSRKQQSELCTAARRTVGGLEIAMMHQSERPCEIQSYPCAPVVRPLNLVTKLPISFEYTLQLVLRYTWSGIPHRNLDPPRIRITLFKGEMRHRVLL